MEHGKNKKYCENEHIYDVKWNVVNIKSNPTAFYRIEFEPTEQKNIVLLVFKNLIQGEIEQYLRRKTKNSSEGIPTCISRKQYGVKSVSVKKSKKKCVQN